MSEHWQPISTAPHTETVLVWNGQRVVAAERSKHSDSWWAKHELYSDWGSELHPKPTHWQPFPDPPNNQGKPE